MSELHKQLSEIDDKVEQLGSEREVLCEQIHGAAVEAERRERLKYKTTIQNGDYGLYNGDPVIFVSSARDGGILLVDYKSIHFEIDMNDEIKESFFIRKGNIFEDISIVDGGR